MSQAKQNSWVLRLWAATEQLTANAAATFSPFDVGGLDPAEVSESGRGGYQGRVTILVMPPLLSTSFFMLLLQVEQLHNLGLLFSCELDNCVSSLQSLSPSVFTYWPVGESSRPSVMRSLHRLLQVPFGLNAVWWLISLSGCWNFHTHTVGKS